MLVYINLVNTPFIPNIILVRFCVFLLTCKIRNQISKITVNSTLFYDKYKGM